jgi:carboxylate-amine ligase
MSPQAETFTIGVEEEYQLIDPVTRGLRPHAERVLPAAQEAVGDEVRPELQLSQLEAVTPVCHTLADVRAELVRLRRAVIAAAARDGGRVAAAGTHPFSHWREQPITPKARYQGLAADYQQLVRELVIFGCHVHVGLGDREAAIRVMNRARPWLAPLLALAANSPFWLGADTGYASFPTELWGRFPLAGPPLPFASRAEHDALVRALVATGSIADATNVYWDVRLPEKSETIEFRVADICPTIDEMVMLAGLKRALVRTCHERALRDEPFPVVRPELLRAAHWRAARYGLEGALIDAGAERTVPAGELIERLLAFVRPALEAAGDWDEVATLVRETVRRGNGAARQRAAYRRAGRWEDVVDFIVAETAKGTATAISA